MAMHSSRPVPPEAETRPSTSYEYQIPPKQRQTPLTSRVGTSTRSPGLNGATGRDFGLG